jgi:hypothetical protein
MPRFENACSLETLFQAGFLSRFFSTLFHDRASVTRAWPQQRNL